MSTEVISDSNNDPIRDEIKSEIIKRECKVQMNGKESPVQNECDFSPAEDRSIEEE